MPGAEIPGSIYPGQYSDEVATSGGGNGSAEYQVTEASGTGHSISPTPTPVVVGPIRRPRTHRVFGSGRAVYARPSAKGRGSITLPTRIGVGRAMLGRAHGVATGRVLPRVGGTGAADLLAPEAFGSGIVVGPDRSTSTSSRPGQRPVIADNHGDYDGYVAVTTRRASRSKALDDDADELLMAGIL